MERKLLAIVMIVLGIIGMAIGGMVFINGSGNLANISQVIAYVVSGAALFFAGIDFIMPQQSTGKVVADSKITQKVREDLQIAPPNSNLKNFPILQFFKK